jgi:hypothetical protein
MNTSFSYLYRDACNYKTFHAVVISGIIQQKQVVPLLKDELLFIPSDVGLPDLQEDVFSAEDHVWHELEKIELTEDAPSIEIDAKSLMARFRIASDGNWDEYAVFKRKGLL